jgi:para-nitrobenzyl esterase
MSTYWTNFAKTGNPNSASLAEWKPFNISENKVMVLDVDEQGLQPIPVMDQFNFLDKYQSYLRNK